MLGLVLMVWVDLKMIPVVVTGYVVQIGLAAAAIGVREHGTRRKIYLVFLSLLTIDVVAAWLFPFLFLIFRGMGE
jgi:hypothetical protein